jgi:hypothetical protein
MLYDEDDMKRLSANQQNIDRGEVSIMLSICSSIWMFLVWVPLRQ